MYQPITEDPMVVGLLYILFGIAAYCLAPNQDFAFETAAFFPKFLSVVLVVLGIFETAKSFMKYRGSRSVSQKKEQIQPRSLIFLSFCVVYVLLIYLVGFYKVTPFALMIFVRFFGLSKWSKIITVTFLVIISIYIFFTLILGLHLPTGIVFR